jgi:alcohol dehydrogenase
MNAFEFLTRTRVVFGEGSLGRLGELARDYGFKRTLLVADEGLVSVGYVAEAEKSLRSAGIETLNFHDFDVNPDSVMVERGREFAEHFGPDSLIALGGGSSMDCAKAINFLLTNGGRIRDYWGFGKASKPMLPMIAIPTTTGTGSEAQSYALISDAETHVKMACGDPKAAFKIALLDPLLTVSQPASVTATAGYDAISHAVETYVTIQRSPFSEMLSREAWRLLESNYERVLDVPTDVPARGAMLVGAHLAGLAIENSMLGATHACANPLTARYGTSHGVAIALLLPHVVRWNGDSAEHRYDELARLSGSAMSSANGSTSCEVLAGRLDRLATVGGLPRSLSAVGIPRSDLSALAEEAALQWTGRFNPRKFDADGALEVYQCAY